MLGQRALLLLLRVSGFLDLRHRGHDLNGFMRFHAHPVLFKRGLALARRRCARFTVAPCAIAALNKVEDCKQGAADALGLMGAALALLWIFAIGVSLLFRFSWLNVAERIGSALFAIFHFVQRCYSAWRDRKAGASAARQREAALEQDRMRMEAHEPVQIVSAVPKIEKSGHAQQEKQRALSEHTSSGSLPSLSLLDAPPPAQEAISADTLEFTSRLIEKKLQDFGVEVSVAAAYPGPVITR